MLTNKEIANTGGAQDRRSCWEVQPGVYLYRQLITTKSKITIRDLRQTITSERWTKNNRKHGYFPEHKNLQYIGFASAEESDLQLDSIPMREKDFFQFHISLRFLQRQWTVFCFLSSRFLSLFTFPSFFHFSYTQQHGTIIFRSYIHIQIQFS